MPCPRVETFFVEYLDHYVGSFTRMLFYVAMRLGYVYSSSSEKHQTTQVHTYRTVSTEISIRRDAWKRSPTVSKYDLAMTIYLDLNSPDVSPGRQISKFDIESPTLNLVGASRTHGITDNCTL